MDAVTATAVQSPVLACRNSGSIVGSRSVTNRGPDFARFRAVSLLPTNQKASFNCTRPLLQKMCCRSRTFVVRASASDKPSGSSDPVAPLQMESPVGQFLSQILASHPHLVPAAVEQQLDQLQTDRDAEDQTKDSSNTGTDLVLYRRIAEVKANERKKALEEILYALVVQKFMDANVSLVPSINSSSDPSGRVDTWPTQEEKLERLHSPESYEMIQNHLALILGNRLGDSASIAQISKLRVGQVYAASVMYGYFLKRVDERFQLEKTMKILPGGSDESIDTKIEDGGASESYRSLSSHPEVSSFAGGFANGIKPSRLRTYVMSFDGETLQRYATIRSKEAVSIIEKHTEALFGRPEIVMTPQGTVDSSSDEQIKISFGGLKRLVLEAVTFGFFPLGRGELCGFQVPFRVELKVERALCVFTEELGL